jgi:hypothetical protein
VKSFEKQALSTSIASTVRLSPASRRADVDSERLWKGLERFVNCGDNVRDFQDLGRAFPGFWPVGILYRPDSKAVFPQDLQWHPACHRLFLCYRNALRDIWKGDTEVSDECASFLLWLTDLNRVACKPRKSDRLRLMFDSLLRQLRSAWKQVHTEFPTAAPSGRVRMGLLWGCGEFYLDLENRGGYDFLGAFYLLFRQSWRARLCARCNIFFVARRPKQTFCGTACSAGSRNASKLKWWHRSGAKRRAHQRKMSLKRDLVGRRGR